MKRPLNLILASGSPRRAELIRGFGLEPKVIPVDADETPPAGANPRRIVEVLAERKVKTFLGRHATEGATHVLGADTLVFLDGSALGKPANREEAREYLELLSGREHEVRTGLCLYTVDGEGWDVDSECTTVRVAPLEASDVSWYLNTGEWNGVAGAYRLQGLGSVLAEGVVGDHSNVIGLPMRLFYGMVLRSGYLFPGQ